MADSARPSKPVGAIPSAALNSITDPNTRAVLQTLVDGWNVRNGNSGTGDNQFVTRADLGLSGGGSIVAQQNSQIQQPKTDYSDPTVAQVNRIITDIQNQVMNSELFQALGARVDLIDKPTTGILTQLGNVVTGLAQETTNRANADNAIVQTTTTQYTQVNESLALVQQQVNTVSNAQSSQAQTLNQVQASVGNNSTAIAQETTARVTADGELFGQYTVKIEQNGYVSGYGLASTANNSKPSSMFVVRADAFAVGSPSGPGIVPTVPFVVYTTPWTFGGETIPAGVYMQSAMIANGTIGTAQIGNAAVDTLKIMGNAVTVPSVVQRTDGMWGGNIQRDGFGSYTGSLFYSAGVTINLVKDIALTQVLVFATQGNNDAGNRPAWFAQLHVDGQSVALAGGYAWSNTFTMGWAGTLAQGPHTFELWWGSETGQAAIFDRSIIVLACKR